MRARLVIAVFRAAELALAQPISFMSEVRIVLLVLVLVGADTALAQVRYRSDKAPPPIMPNARPACADFSVETQVALRRAADAREEEAERVDFVITAAVGNPCDEPLQVRQGSGLSYETNFPFSASGAGQPPGCQAREFSFAGLVPPHSRQPFTLAVQNCAFAGERSERPWVAVTSGRVLTDRGERPMPATNRSLP